MPRDPNFQGNYPRAHSLHRLLPRPRGRRGGCGGGAEGLENAMRLKKGSAGAKCRDRDLKESADRHSTPDRSPDGDTKWQYRCPESALHSSKVKPTFYSVETREIQPSRMFCRLEFYDSMASIAKYPNDFKSRNDDLALANRIVLGNDQIIGHTKCRVSYIGENGYNLKYFLNQTLELFTCSHSSAVV